MDADQIKVLNAITNGHNVVLLGQAGTGKTFTIKESVQHLRAAGKRVSLCCYTGIAWLQYESLQAMTLHHFAGLEDGRHGNDKLVHLIQTDERFFNTKSRIIETDTLVIDEVSMVSKKIFESVEYLCRHIRGNTTCFGGIQVILSGDFFQLKPVADELYGDSGRYCFESDIFSLYFPHIICFKTVHRQAENELIKCISELGMGTPSDETNTYLKKLSRPLPQELPNEVEIVKLFARNIDVDMHNYEQFRLVEGNSKIYEAIDFGDSHYLNKLIVPKKLALKVSVKVMLLKNVSDQLVNGLIGTVIELSDDYVKVKFILNGTPKVAQLIRYNFTKFDPVMNVCIARRFQFPLRLAYAITMHKAQGMSIPYLEIDCKHATNPGQIGVAVGRAVSSKGLRVINYSPYLVKKHSYKVYNFYEEVSDTGILTDNLTCCKATYVGQVQPENIEEAYADSELEEFERALDGLSTSENHKVTVTLDHTYCDRSALDLSLSRDHTYSTNTVFLEAESTFKKALDDYIDTPMEVAAKHACDQILSDRSSVTKWYQTQQINITNIYRQCCTSPPGDLKQKHFTDFHSSFNRYIASDEYLSESHTLLQVPFSNQLLTSVLFLIQASILQTESESVQSDHCHLSVLPGVGSTISSAGQGKIRYVGGYCIAKCRYRLCKSMKSCLFTPGMEHEVNNLKQQINLLDKMTVTATEIISTSTYKDTLEETSIKQNVCESLVNISDTVYDFFISLEIASRKLMTYEVLIKEPKYMFRYTVDTLLADKELFECFVRNCCAYEASEECSSLSEVSAVYETCDFLSQTCACLILIFEKIVKLFVAVAFSQFRKDYIRVIKREKGKALRKKVLEKKSKQNSSNLNIAFITADESPGKTVSHLKLKAIAIEYPLFYTNYKKVEITQLLKAYGQSYSSKSTKDKLGEQLYNYLVNEDSLVMCNPGALGLELSQKPSTQQSHMVSVSLSQDAAQEPGTSQDTSTCETTVASGTTSLQVTLSKSTDLKGRRKKATSKAPRQKKSTLTVKSSKRKTKKSDTVSELDNDSDLCGICSKKEQTDEFWISCDSCFLWFHRECVGLDDEDDWTYFSGTSSVYICPLCQ